MKNFISKLIEILEPIANKHETLDFMYWVTQSTTGNKIDKDNMSDHASCEDFCEDCIDNAVENKHKEWSIERNVLMGQIYEAEQKGFFTYFGFSNDIKSKYVFRKVKASSARIANMKHELKHEYRIGTLFSKEGLHLIGYEKEGFCFCESCGKMFNTNLLLNDQELEHWEELEDSYYKTIEPQTAYELTLIFYEGRCENHELNKRVIKLANRIYNLIK